MLVAMAATTFIACEDVPEPYGKPYEKGNNTEIEGAKGTGTKDDPFNCIAALNYGNGLASGEVSGDYYYAYIDSIAARINDEPEPEPEPVAIDSPESSLDAVVIAPNPATTTATISGIQHACQIAVIDQNGRSMMTMQHDASASPLSINVSTLPKGIYYVRISSSSAAVTRKLIVR